MDSHALMCHKNEADRIKNALLPVEEDNCWIDLSRGPSVHNFSSCKLNDTKAHNRRGKCITVTLPDEKGRRKSRQGYLLMVITGGIVSPAHLPPMARRQISWAGRLTHETYLDISDSKNKNEEDSVRSMLATVCLEVWRQLLTVHRFNIENDLLRLDVHPKWFNSEVCIAMQAAAKGAALYQKITSEDDGPIKLTHSASNASNIVSIIVCSTTESIPNKQSASIQQQHIYWGMSTATEHWNNLNQKMNDHASKEVVLETTVSVTGLDVSKEGFSHEVPVSRAYYKLAQVFEDNDNLHQISRMHGFESGGLLHPKHISSDQLLSHGSGLDIGASPGGWTQVMHTMLKIPTIVAVDPGVLAQRVATLPGVHHLHNDISSDEAMECLARHAPFSCVVCDACVDVATLFDKLVQSFEGASLLLENKSLFALQLCLVVTLKFPFKTSGSIGRHMECSKQLISNFLRRIALLVCGDDSKQIIDVDVSYKICHLFANSVSERTVIALFGKRK